MLCMFASEFHILYDRARQNISLCQYDPVHLEGSVTTILRGFIPLPGNVNHSTEKDCLVQGN